MIVISAKKELKCLTLKKFILKYGRDVYNVTNILAKIIIKKVET